MIAEFRLQIADCRMHMLEPQYDSLFIQDGALFAGFKVREK